ncbi:hypothetical protein [Hazenella coriacea]|uniref:Uncharacterized protein n=1 Tax=Hazenella coriacea TaxID=1179467 RepID=A0A4R3LBG1_9BACL|nr:hypothetical protein [Hazenella coriacea]TCS96638.1 hypothetical protein EDD58_101274 [Hazenella coriacea]
MWKWAERLLIDRCPVCEQRLEVDYDQSSSLITVKACPSRHYTKETYPFLEQTFEFYPSKKENIRRGR